MNISTDQIQEIFEDTHDNSLDQKYDRNGMEFSIVLRVKDINRSIEYYCRKLGFVFERIEKASNFSVRAYLRPFETANTYFCLEQYVFTCSDTEEQPKVYVEIMPGHKPMDYEDFIDELHYDKGVQFDYDPTKTRTLVSVLKDPDENPIWIQDGFDDYCE